MTCNKTLWTILCCGLGELILWAWWCFETVSYLLLQGLTIHRSDCMHGTVMILRIECCIHVNDPVDECCPVRATFSYLTIVYTSLQSPVTDHLILFWSGRDGPLHACMHVLYRQWCGICMQSLPVWNLGILHESHKNFIGISSISQEKYRNKKKIPCSK
jgi:hypothetical protein